MAYCTPLDVFKEEVGELTSTYETLIDNDSLDKNEAVEASEVLKELTSYSAAAKKSDKAYIEGQSVFEEANNDRQAILEQTIKDSLGDSFWMSFNSSDEEFKASLVSAKPTQSGILLTVDTGPSHSTFVFAPDSDTSNPTKGGTSATIPGLEAVFDAYSRNLDLVDELDRVLGSSDDKYKKLSNKYKQEGYVHGDLDHMRNMVKYLHILGGEKASDEELDHLLGLTDKMSPEFFRKLDLFIKEDASVKSKGFSLARRIDITVNKAPKDFTNQLSEASIYMEEVLHSMTAAALSSTKNPTGSKGEKARRLKRELNTVIESARKQVKWEDFLPNGGKDSEGSYSDEDKKHARWLYDYIFEGDNADYEFLAKGLATPEVAKVFKNVKVRDKEKGTTLLSKLYDFFEAVMDMLKGDLSLQLRDSNVHDALMNLAFNLGEINAETTKKLGDEYPLVSMVMDFVNRIDDATAHKLNTIKDSMTEKWQGKDIGDMPDSYYARVKWVIQLIGASIVNPVYTKTMGAIASSWGLKPGGVVREVIGNLFASDEVQKAAEFLVLQSGKIDKARNTEIDAVRNLIFEGFSDRKKVTTALEEAMTDVLADTDVASLFGKDSITKDRNLRDTSYSNKTLRTLMTDDEALENHITQVKRALKELDRDNYTFHRDQSVGLGYFMATHKGTPEQLSNAENIARGLRGGTRKRAYPKVVKAIDELASLVALQNTDKASREAVADLMKEEWRGVQQVADIINGFKINSANTVFKNNRTNQIKGYSKEIFDDSIVMQVALAEDESKMKAQGFTKKSNLPPRAGDIRKKPMALYVSGSAFRTDRLRAAARLNPLKAKGESIAKLGYIDDPEASPSLLRERGKRDVSNLELQAKKRIEQMEKGTYSFKDATYGVMATLNDSGKVVDFRYMMDKETKKSLLKMDRRISEVMAKSFGSLVDKEASREHNKRILSFLATDMRENYGMLGKGKDGLTEYTLIGPEVENEEMRKLYYMLPKEFQSYIKGREDKVLAVRSDLRDMIFGYSHLSIMDFPMLSKVTPAILEKLIRMAEDMWVEMIKVVKTNILIKTPTVLVNNILSNFLYGVVVKGYNPVTLLKAQVQSYKNIRAYNNNRKEIHSLKVQRRQAEAGSRKDGISTKRQAELRREVNTLGQKIDALVRRNSEEYGHIEELVNLGLDQNLEDVTNDLGRDSNKISNFFEKRLENAPELVKTGADILFITKRTALYKLANEFLETSDLISRDVQNTMDKIDAEKQANGQKILPDWWLEGQEEGYESKQRLKGVERKLFLEQAKKQREYGLVEDYINYAMPSSKLEEYLNRIGILMFTKYVKRIQRIIMKGTKNSPLKTAVGITGLGFILGLPSIHESSALAKDWYEDSTGPGNIFPIYSPVENLMNFLTPPAIALAEDVL